jgi:hypothetical protein
MSGQQNAPSRSAPVSRRGTDNDPAQPLRSRTTISFQTLAQQSDEPQRYVQQKVRAYELPWQRLKAWLLERFRDEPEATFDERVRRIPPR